MEKTVQVEEHHADSVPWTPRDVWLGLVAFGLGMAAFILFQFLTYKFSLELNPGLTVTLAELVLLGPAWWLTVRKYDLGWEALGLRRFEGSALGLGCGLMLFSFTFNVVYALFLDLFGLRVQQDMVPVFTDLSYPWLLLLGGVVIGPVVEEIFFRGFVFAGLRQRYGWQRAALVSSAIFALFHMTPTAVIPIFLLGYIFCYLYQQSDSIWPPTLMHVLTNAWSLGVAFVLANA
jgi:membrane protease YdiL (CAAX protease family)